MDFYKAFQLVANINIGEFEKIYLKEEKDNYRKGQVK